MSKLNDPFWNPLYSRDSRGECDATCGVAWRRMAPRWTHCMVKNVINKRYVYIPSHGWFMALFYPRYLKYTSNLLVKFLIFSIRHAQSWSMLGDIPKFSPCLDKNNRIMWFCRSPDVRGNPGCSDGASQTRGDETSGVQGVDPGYFMLGGLTWILSLKVFF